MNSFPFPRPLVFGHRGYSALATENTLPAFSVLKEKKIDAVEFDVHLCASGELVIIHDFQTGRVFEQSLPVAETSYAKLKTLSVNEQHRKPSSIRGLPRLDDVLDLLGRDVIYDIELKSYSTKPYRLVSDVLAKMKAFGISGQSIISSFNPFCTRCAAALRHPHIAYIYSNEKDVYFFLRRGEARRLSRASLFKPNYLDLEKWWNRRLLKKRPNIIATWTVDSVDVAEKYYRKGVSGFISNDPLPVKQHLEKLTPR
ncbi:MAG: glycerophosphodiester phosphodiesterase [Spirochaetales bacterium]|nr:glycerophosphodiester phosphodiesterase [Spirochaetales bacterium]